MHLWHIDLIPAGSDGVVVISSSPLVIISVVVL